MAINIFQDLSIQPYPAYNSSYIKFTSDINPTKAEISVSGIANPFVLYPDPAGNFIFDFMEVAKASFSVKGFDHIGVETFDWGQSFSGNLATVNLSIRTYNGGTSDILTKSYEFYKGVFQVGEPVTNNYLLSPQTDPLTYDLTYWEGFPFSIQIQKLSPQDKIAVLNRNTGAISPIMIPQFTGGFSIHIDKINTNWTESDFLPLTTNLNRLEVYEDSSFKCNLNLTKKQNCAGIYLRFFNNQGGFSYHLFDEFFRDTLSTSIINQIATNGFDNVGSLKNPLTSTGRSGGVKYRLKTTVNRAELKVLRQLFTSPKIQYWTSQKAFEQGTWIDVGLDSGNLPIDTKKDIQPITVTIEFPELNTLSL